jgi:hypothetical protein
MRAWDEAMVRAGPFRPTIHAFDDFALSLRHHAAARQLLLALVLASGAMIAVPVAASVHNHVAASRLELPASLMLGTEGGLPERFGQLMLLASSVLLLYAGFSRRSIWLAFFALLYAFAFADDALMYHERMGGTIARRLALPSLGELAAKDLGELLAWGLAGAAMLIPAALALRQRSPLLDGHAGVLALLFGALVFCAIVMDAVHALIGANTLGRLSGIVEDGGELLVTAVTCAYAFTLAGAPRRVQRRLTPPRRGWASD